MTDYQRLYNGVSKAAWGYFFLYFDFNINSVSLLPSFVGFLLFLSAIDHLKDEERDLALLRPLGILLALWHGAQWLASWVGVNLDGGSQFIDMIVCLANLYFHFQLLTNLASLAAKYQPSDVFLDAKLLRYRTLQTVMLTGMTVLTDLSSWFVDFWAVISILMAVVYLIAGICLMKALFDLRRVLPESGRTL